MLMFSLSSDHEIQLCTLWSHFYLLCYARFVLVCKVKRLERLGANKFNLCNPSHRKLYMYHMHPLSLCPQHCLFYGEIPLRYCVENLAQFLTNYPHLAS